MRRFDPDLDPDLQRFVERATAQITVPPRRAQRARRLALLPLLGPLAVLVVVVAAALGVGRVLNDAHAVVATQPPATIRPSASTAPSREPAQLAELPDERAVEAAFDASGVAVQLIGESKFAADLGPLLPARVFIVTAGSAGADVLFLRGRGLGPVSVCGAPGSTAGRTTYSIYVDGQRTSGVDAGQNAYFLVSPDYFVEAYDTATRDALARGLGLAAAQCPDRVRIGGHSYRLTADLSRDFMPVAPPGGRPLLAILLLTSDDGSAFPLSIDADHIWVFNGNQTWDASSVELRRAPDAGTPSNAMEIVAREGPKWDPGTRVDVVVRVHAGGVEYLIGLQGVEIKMTS